MAPIAAVLLFVVATAFERCDACRAEGATVELCAPHAEAERASIARNGPRVLDADEERAKAALADLAALTSQHENAPSAALARTLASGIANPSWSVRGEVLRLLQAGQDESVTREVLITAGDRFAIDAREIGKVRKAVAKLAEESSARKSDDVREALERMSSKGEEMQRLLSVVVAFQGYTEELVRGLERPEDECVDALLRVAQGISEADLYSIPVTCALARSGRRDALQRAVEFLDDWQSSLDELADSEKAERKRKLDPKPDYFQGSDESWETRARAARDKRVEMARARVEMHQKNGREMHDAFAAMVRARDLGVEPEWNDRPYSVWRSWLQRHRADLPERLAPAPAPAAGG